MPAPVFSSFIYALFLSVRKFERVEKSRREGLFEIMRRARGKPLSKKLSAAHSDFTALANLIRPPKPFILYSLNGWLATSSELHSW
jgi:hypothetical protein